MLNFNNILKPKSVDDISNEIFHDSNELSCFNFYLKYEKHKELFNLYKINILKLNIKLKHKLYYIILTNYTLDVKYYFIIHYPIICFYIINYFIINKVFVIKENIFTIFNNIFLILLCISSILSIISTTFGIMYYKKKRKYLKYG